MSEWKEGGRDGWMDESQVHLVFSRSNNLFAPPDLIKHYIEK